MKRIGMIATMLAAAALAGAVSATAASAAPRLFLENNDTEQTVLTPSDSLEQQLGLTLVFAKPQNCLFSGSGHLVTNGKPTDSLSFANALEKGVLCGGEGPVTRVSGGERVTFKLTAARTAKITFTPKLAFETTGTEGFYRCVYELRKLEGFFGSTNILLELDVQGAAARNPRLSEYRCAADVLVEDVRNLSTTNIFSEGHRPIATEVRPA